MTNTPSSTAVRGDEPPSTFAPDTKIKMKDIIDRLSAELDADGQISLGKLNASIWKAVDATKEESTGHKDDGDDLRGRVGAFPQKGESAGLSKKITMHNPVPSAAASSALSFDARLAEKMAGNGGGQKKLDGSNFGGGDNAVGAFPRKGESAGLSKKIAMHNPVPSAAASSAMSFDARLAEKMAGKGGGRKELEPRSALINLRPHLQPSIREPLRTMFKFKPKNPFRRARKAHHIPAGIQPVEVVPAGIQQKNNDSGRSVVISSIDVNDTYVEGQQHRNTFSVKAKHETLAQGLGVRFNVETLPVALERDLKKAMICKDELLERVQKDALAFYEGDQDSFRGYQVSKPGDVRVEALSEVLDTTVFVGGSGFFVACLTAFAQHLPLALSPDHVWSVLSYAFAKHVDKHAEELRKNFVQHEGKKRLEVKADHMVMSGGDLTKGSSSQEWESTIFPSFSSQIKDHIGEKVHSVITSDFTTTTNTARAAHEITLMAAMKNYFSYGMYTMCGIPQITLLGSEQDWVSLRARAEDLGKLMTQEVRDSWICHLLPVLDEFVNSYKGNVKHGFWQSMVKLRDTGGVSGSHLFISGWIQLFFPYLRSGRFNTRLRPWNEMYFDGPDPDDIPTIVSSAPVDWDYYGTTYNLHFHAGITGFTQDPVDGCLTPLIGWYVTHDPPKDPDVRLEEVKGEIEALLKGHKEEAQTKSLDETAPWFRRVCSLYAEQVSLEGPARLVVLKREIDGVKQYGEDYCSIQKKVKKMEEDIKNQSKAQIPVDELIKSFFSKT